MIPPPIPINPEKNPIIPPTTIPCHNLISRIIALSLPKNI